MATACFTWLQYDNINRFNNLIMFRFLTVYRPKIYSRGSARIRLYVVSILVWVLALLVDIPIMIFSNIDDHGQCNVVFPGTATKVSQIPL